MLDASRPGNIRHMDQTVYTVFDLDKCAEVRQVSHAAVYAGADLITLVQSLPGVVLNLFHPEADAARLGIDTEDLDFHFVARVDQLARMLDAFRPAHFRNMDQAFDAIF